MAIRTTSKNSVLNNSALKSQNIRAVGGTVTEVGNYVIHTFTSTGTFTVLDPELTVEYLIVGGGGAGGQDFAGGGGGGGFLTGHLKLNAQSYTATVGAGATRPTSSGQNKQGSNSSFASLTAVGGGGGTGSAVGENTGRDGGSGGGGSLTYRAGTGIIGQGHQGGTNTSSTGPSGGGGAGGEGGATGIGGPGRGSSITGTLSYYAGGGGGGTSTTGTSATAGGLGGGGAGSVAYQDSTQNGGTNTGGGGGGYYGSWGGAGNGGSGIVVVRYRKDGTPFNISKVTREGIIMDLDGNNFYSYPRSLAVDYLVVAGGGGGGAYAAGAGGGGGGFVTGNTVLYSKAHTVIVGAGGTGGTWATTAATNGGNSSVFSITAIGGGHGGQGWTASPGGVGGSGGGTGGFDGNGNTNLTGGAVNNYAGQGRKGGAGKGVGINDGSGGGGGGANAVGGDGNNSTGGDGGAGRESAISGSTVTYAGGGGGSRYQGAGGVGGAGGGGAGGNPPGNGTTNTGGGGGGSRGLDAVLGGSGGSGIVIIRYLGAQKATGGAVTTSGNYTVHTFTSTGVFSIYDNVWEDLSGNGNDLTLQGSPRFDSSQGGAIVFDGVDDYANQAIAYSHLYSSSFEVWFSLDSINQTKRKMIVGYQHNSGYSQPPIGSLWVDATGILRASLIQAGTGYVTATGSTLQANTVYHAVFNKDTINGNLELYVNGSLSGTASFNVASFAQWTTVNSYIGVDNLDVAKSTNTSSGQLWDESYLNGKIYSIRMYNRPLANFEVLQNFNAMRGNYGI